MQNKNKISKQLIVVCLLLGFASLGFSMFFAGKSTGAVDVDFKDLPMQIADWEGEDVEVDNRVYEILETKNVLVRKYTKPDSLPVHVSIVYAADNRSAFHPPEICYEGSSYKLLSKTSFPVHLTAEDKDFDVNRLLLAHDNVPKLLSCYWFMLGDNPSANYYKQQVALVVSELTNKNAVGAIVQVTTPIVNSDEEDANKRISDFIDKGFSPISGMLD